MLEIWDEIERQAAARPQALALIRGDERIAYGAFARDIAATRRWIEGLGLSRGQTVAVVAADLYEAWRLVRGARTAGLDTIAVSRAAQVGELKVRDVAAVLAPAREAPSLALDGEGLALHLAPADLPAAEDQAPTQPGGAHLLYTSGTTGAYKKLRLDGAGEAARNRFRAANSRNDATTLAHAQDYGLWTGIGFKTPAAVWSVGGAVIVDQRADRMARLTEHAPTYCQVLPDALRAALDARAADAAPSPGLELLVAGGFLPLALARGARARLANQVFSHYGATELFGGVMQQRFEHPEDLHWLTPNPARRIEVADEAGQVCAIGVEGDLRVEVEAHDIAAYLDDPEATAQCFRDGFFHPGDRAVRRADGRIRVLGRAVDVINLAGQKRAVAPIERSLEEALDVEEVCLFSHLADDGVEEVVVAVQSRAPRDPAQLARALGGSADFGRVRVAVFEAFPRTAGGHAKTNRVALRAMLRPRPAPG